VTVAAAPAWAVWLALGLWAVALTLGAFAFVFVRRAWRQVWPQVEPFLIAAGFRIGDAAVEDAIAQYSDEEMLRGGG